MSVKNIAVYMLARLAPAAITMFTVYFYTNSVDPEQYGLFSKVSAIAAITYPLLFAPIWYFLLQNKSPVYQIASNQAYSVFFVIAFLMLSAAPFIYIFSSPDISKEIFAIALMAILYGNIQIRLEELRIDSRPKSYLILASLRAVLILGISFIFIKYDFHYLLSPLIDGVLTGILICILPIDIGLFKNLKFKGISRSFSLIYRYGFYLSLYSILNTMLFSIDRILIAFINSDHQAGLYSSSYDLAMKLIHTLVFSIELSMLPMLLKVKNDGGSLQEQFIENTKTYLFIMMPITIGLVSITPSLCNLYFPEDYREVAFLVFPVIAVSTFIAGFANAIYHHSYILSGKNSKLFKIIFYVLIFNLTTNSVLDYFGDPMYSSVIALMSFSIYSFFTYLNTVAYCQYRFPIKFFCTILMLCTPMIAFAIFYGFSNQALILIFEIFIFIFLYLSGIIIFNVFQFRDKLAGRFLRL